MNISVKSLEDMKKMKDAGKIVADILNAIRQKIAPGITTLHLEIAAEKLIKAYDVKSSFKGYEGFPAAVCVSVNNEVVHGIPGLRILKEGDIVSVDIAICLDGFHADAARTFAVGTISDENQRLIDVTEQSFYEGLKFAKAGNYIHQISAAIENFILKHNFHVLKEYGGHGIGRNLHELPSIPNFLEKDAPKIKLVKGMTLAIEPVVNFSDPNVVKAFNEITILTKNGCNSAHFENTIAITEGEAEIFT